MASFRSETTIYFHFAVIRSASSKGVSLAGKGFINLFSSTKLVARRCPPFGS